MNTTHPRLHWIETFGWIVVGLAFFFLFLE